MAKKGEGNERLGRKGDKRTYESVLNHSIHSNVSGGVMDPNKDTGKVSNATCVTWADTDSYRCGTHLWRRPARAGVPRNVGSGA